MSRAARKGVLCWTPVFLLAALALPGCHAVRATYARPYVQVPATYAHADSEVRASLDRWWEAYGDASLNELVNETLRVNPDLALAALNIRAASDQIHLAGINPVVAVGYTYDYSKPLSGGGLATRFHALTASVSYEVDLWGQLAAQRDAARWEERATDEDRESAALLLIGSVVNLYFEIAELNHEIASGEASLAEAEEIFRLTQALESAGAVSALDLAVAEQTLQGEHAVQAQLVEQRVERRNALTVLLAGAPWPEAKERIVLPHDLPAAVDAGLPATLLDRRPDLKAAELRLRETLAQTDATRLSFYPNLALTGSVGTASTGLSELISNPLGSLAATLTAPFLQWNEAHFAAGLARAQYDEAVLRFKKSLWQALSDVDNALAARAELAQEAAALEQSEKSAERVERLTIVRYRAGAVSLTSLLDAERSRRQADIALSANRLSRLENYAMLCQALGGGTVRLGPNKD